MIIGIDFDGTVCTHSYPFIGNDIGAIPVLRKLVDKKHKLILFTMRSNKGGTTLTDAVNWFKENNIPLYGVNSNPSQWNWTSSPKPYCNLYIDDAALGCPLVYGKHDRPYVDWIKVEDYLSKLGLL